MKVLVFGKTLQASTLSVILAESGNHIYRLFSEPISFSDKILEERLQKQYVLNNIINVNYHSLPDVDVCLFCYSPSEFSLAMEELTLLNLQNLSSNVLMINASTFGMHGTARLKALFSYHDWVYLSDVVQEGNAIANFLNAPQLIVGIESERSKILFKELFRAYHHSSQSYLFMPILDAEFTKLSIAGMLATRISYINDLALVAEKLGVDIHNVRDGMMSDARIGKGYLAPGVGFGGESFSLEILTLSGAVSKSGAKSHLLDQVWQINEDQKELLFRKLWIYYKADLQGKIISVWGGAYKERSASTYNSPVHALLKALWAQGVTVKLHDPMALSEIAEIYGERRDLILYHDEYEALQDSHALCLVTPWRQYFNPDYERMHELMRAPVILDGRNIYDPEFIRNQGFYYEGVGR